MNLVSLVTRGYITPPYFKIVPLEVCTAEVVIDPDLEIAVTVDEDALNISVIYEDDLDVSVTVCEDD